MIPVTLNNLIQLEYFFILLYYEGPQVRLKRFSPGEGTMRYPNFHFSAMYRRAKVKCDTVMVKKVKTYFD